MGSDLFSSHKNGSILSSSDPEFLLFLRVIGNSVIIILVIIILLETTLEVTLLMPTGNVSLT